MLYPLIPAGGAGAGLAAALIAGGGSIFACAGSTCDDEGGMEGRVYVRDSDVTPGGADITCHRCRQGYSSSTRMCQTTRSSPTPSPLSIILSVWPGSQAALKPAAFTHNPNQRELRHLTCPSDQGFTFVAGHSFVMEGKRVILGNGGRLLRFRAHVGEPVRGGGIVQGRGSQVLGILSRARWVWSGRGSCLLAPRAAGRPLLASLFQGNGCNLRKGLAEAALSVPNCGSN